MPIVAMFAVLSQRAIPILTAVNAGTPAIEWVWLEANPPQWRIETSPTGIHEWELWQLTTGDAREWTILSGGSAFWRVIGVENDDITPATPHSNAVQQL